jgi:hypothetical protein
MIPSESAPQELSNEWSCRYVLTILNLLGNFCVPLLVTGVTFSPLRFKESQCFIWLYVCKSLE